MQLGLNYMSYVGGSNFAGVRFAHSAGERAAWSGAIQYFGYGSIKGTDVSGNFTGDFSPKDIAFTGSYSHDITDRLRGGFNIKLLYSGYEQYSALALATDLGINYYDEERDMSLSAVVANLGGQIKRFSESYDRLPVDVRLGWSKGLNAVPVRLSVTAWNLTRWKTAVLRDRRRNIVGASGTEGLVCLQPVQALGLCRRADTQRPVPHRYRVQLQDAHRHEHILPQFPFWAVAHGRSQGQDVRSRHSLRPASHRSHDIHVKHINESI